MNNKKYKITITWCIIYEFNGQMNRDTTEIIVYEDMIFGIINQILNLRPIRIEVTNV